MKPDLRYIKRALLEYEADIVFQEPIGEGDAVRTVGVLLGATHEMHDNGQLTNLSAVDMAETFLLAINDYWRQVYDMQARVIDENANDITEIVAKENKNQLSYQHREYEKLVGVDHDRK